MRPHDRGRLAEALKARGLPEPTWEGTTATWARDGAVTLLWDDGLRLLAREERPRHIGIFDYGARFEALVDAIARELRP